MGDNAGVVYPLEERRLVTVLFADLVGFTGRSEATDPEAVRDLQRAYFGRVSAEVEQLGGVLEKFIGDAAVAIFGAPVAHDDDAERALHAALAIRHAVREIRPDLEVRIGVNTGEVVGGRAALPSPSAAMPSALDYTVTGDAVNVAARLQQAAAPGEIYVGPVTQRLGAETFEFEALGDLGLKGKVESVEAWRLVRALPERPRVRRSTPLVGRTRELAALEAALAEAAEGRGLVLALAGEAGVGKSRLAIELQTRAGSMALGWYWASARSYGTSLPYRLVAELLRELLGRAEGQPIDAALLAAGATSDAATAGRWGAVIGAIFGEIAASQESVALSPQGRQHLLVQALIALLAGRSRARPTIVVLDDLHWADGASLAVLDELVDAVAGLSVLLIAVYRSGWTHAWSGKPHYQQLNLGGLRAAEARRLTGLLAGDTPVPAELEERLLERSGGNPFFLEELLRAAAEGGGAVGAPDQRLPETIHEVVLARIDALDPAARQALQLASVVGMEFSEPVLAAVEPTLELSAALPTLQRLDLVVFRPGPLEERRFLFRHPLIHEVAYRSLLVSRRRELHGRVARWLEERGGEDVLPVLAAHYAQSADRPKALKYLRLAADRAASVFAIREAARWYLEAAESGEDTATQAALVRQAAQQTYLTGDIDGALELVRRAISLYESADRIVQALDTRRLLGRYLWFAGRGEAAEREIDAAMEGLEKAGPTPELALAYAYKGQIRALTPDFEQGVSWARKAIEMAEPLGAIEALVHASNTLGMSLAESGNPTALAHVRRSLDLALEHGLVDDAGRAYVNLSGQGNQIMFSKPDDAEALFREALEYGGRTIPGGTYDLWVRTGWAEFLIQTARWDEAELVLVDLERDVRSNRYLELATRAFRALVDSYRGFFDRAHERMDGAAEPALRVGDLQATLPVFAAIAHAEAGRGNAEAAALALRQAIEGRAGTKEAVISVWFLFEAADVAAMIGRSGDEGGLRAVLAARFGIEHATLELECHDCEGASAVLHHREREAQDGAR